MPQNEIDKAKEVLTKRHNDLLAKLIEQYETHAEQTEKDVQTLPDWLKLQILATKAEDPSFLLTNYVGTVFAAKEAVKLAAHFDSKTGWQQFLGSPDFDKFGGISEGHTEDTFRLMMGIANKIIERECPDIKIASPDDVPKPNLRLLQ